MKFYPSVELLSSIALALIIWYGGGSVIQEAISLGVLIAFIQYTEMFFRPIRDLAEKYNIIQSAMASSERVFGLLDNDTIIENPDEPKSLNNVKGKIEFENVCFAYNKDDYVIKNVSFSIEPGETVAIVGATGAGKTSLINLIPRLYDTTEGRILIDDVDVKNIPFDILRTSIGMVPQETFLFSDTLENNILYGVRDKSKVDHKKIAQISQLHKDVEDFKDGYDTILGERGITLSGGQKQRTSLSRALAVDPKILILDDSFSAVDTHTEEEILRNLKSFMKGRTSIIISHRISTVKDSDKIYVLDDSVIAEEGTHDQLLARDGLYAELYQKQLLEEELKELN